MIVSIDMARYLYFAFDLSITNGSKSNVLLKCSYLKKEWLHLKLFFTIGSLQSHRYILTQS